MIEEAEVAEEIGKTEVAGRPQKESAVFACGRSEGNAIQHLWVMQTHEPASRRLSPCKLSLETK